MQHEVTNLPLVSHERSRAASEPSFTQRHILNWGNAHLIRVGGLKTEACKRKSGQRRHANVNLVGP
jgi:hypothetical protein